MRYSVRSARRPAPTISVSAIPAVARITIATITSSSTTPRSLRMGNSGQRVDIRADRAAIGQEQHAVRGAPLAGLNRLRARTSHFRYRLRLSRDPQRGQREATHPEQDAQHGQNNQQLDQRDAPRTHQTLGLNEYTACSSAAAVNATKPPNATINAGSRAVTSARRPRSASCAARFPAPKAISATRPLDSPTIMSWSALGVSAASRSNASASGAPCITRSLLRASRSEQGTRDAGR